MINILFMIIRILIVLPLLPFAFVLSNLVVGIFGFVHFFAGMKVLAELIVQFSEMLWLRKPKITDDMKEALEMLITPIIAFPTMLLGWATIGDPIIKL